MATAAAVTGVVVFVAYLAGSAAELCNELVEIEGSICGNSLRLKYVVTVQNEGDNMEQNVLLAIPMGVRQRAHLTAAVYNDQNVPIGANLSQIEPDFPTPNGETLFSVPLLKSLRKGDQTKILASLDLLDHLEPSPKKVLFRQKPIYMLNIPRYFYSPYTTKSQVGHISFPSSEISVTKETGGFRTNGKRINVDLNQRAEPFRMEYVRVRFEHVDGLLKMERYEKKVLLSHWGAAVVKEDVIVRNVGPQVEQFSRLDYMHMEGTGKQVNVMRQLDVHLPKDAYDVFYKDLNGNITTSRLRPPSKKGRYFEQTFRYPLVGGWKTYYWYGYTLPLSSALKQKGSQFILKVSLQPGVVNSLPVDGATIKIVLPDGASNVDVVLSDSSVEVEDVETVYPTLAYFGRTMVVLKRNAFVADPLDPASVYISYRYALSNLLRAPLMLFFGLAVLLMAVTVFGHVELDMSGKRSEQDVELRLYKHVKALSEIDSKISALYLKLREEIRVYERKDQTAGFKKSQAALLETIERYEGEEADIFSEIGKVSKDEGDKGPTLLTLLKLKREASQKLAAVATRTVEEKLCDENALAEANRLNTIIDSYSERIDIFMSNIISHL
eukprot:Plantae.Rhodophyta-Purpureofilum_apyrenoidigerum.ctg3037.p1 GENE.Plantae.Rhodophyta-Purpureofilum_apyrenoidigerum.ctg3037~~Plantae.Rhodophyta-Purpureofilum_apyrenoidigerum.ctg3037.p1  ORF type:complete len:610 (-),score=124.61 Plantae.Rhodophyta-Purpureofilum_apyrenoidigerum.ctg3037:1244-3073(-)